jgi:hypothetical protein
LINLIQFDLKEEKQRNKEKLLYVDIENFIKCFISNLKILIERPMLYKCLYKWREDSYDFKIYWNYIIAHSNLNRWVLITIQTESIK